MVVHDHERLQYIYGANLVETEEERDLAQRTLIDSFMSMVKNLNKSMVPTLWRGRKRGTQHKELCSIVHVHERLKYIYWANLVEREKERDPIRRTLIDLFMSMVTN